MAVDWGRAPYTRPVRWSTDPNEPPGTISWFVTDLPFVDFPTVFNNRWWNTEEVGNLALGETQIRPFGYNGRWNVPGLLGGHICGTPADFMNGWSGPLPPPVPVDADGFPACCPRAIVGRASMGLRADSTVVQFQGYGDSPKGGARVGGFVIDNRGRVDAPSGGVRIGGFVADVPAYVDPPAGGVRIGGSVADVYAFVDPATGSVRVGGNVTGVVAFVDPLAGGVRVGGSVPGQFAFVDAPTGGARVGGALVDRFGFLDPPTGGVAVGGSVVDRFGYLDPPTGGVRVGGAVTGLYGYVDAPAGGIRVGGSVADYHGYRDQPTGGVRVGGSVAELYGYRDQPTGGVRVGGSVAELYGYRDQPTGGVRVGGSITEVLRVTQPNAIRNGDMFVQQRPGATFPSVTNGQYTLDGWKWGLSGAARHTVQMVFSGTGPPGVSAAQNAELQGNCTTTNTSPGAGDFVFVSQPLEGYIWNLVGGGTFTVGLFLTASRSGTYCLFVQTPSGLHSYVAELSYTTANAPQWFTVSIPAPPSSADINLTTGAGMVIGLTMLCGSTFQHAAGSWVSGQYYGSSNQVNNCQSTSDYFNLTGVCLYPGSSITAFSPRTFDEELRLNRRYYQAFTGLVLGYSLNNTGLYSGGLIDLPEQFRATPSLASSPSAAFTVSSGSAGTVATDEVSVDSIGVFNSAANWTTNVLVTLTAGFTAEL